MACLSTLAPAAMASSSRPPWDAMSRTSSSDGPIHELRSSTPIDSRRASCSPRATATPASWVSPSHHLLGQRLRAGPARLAGRRNGACARLASVEAEGSRSAPAIRTERLTKHYGSVQALNALSLDVRRGEIFGFLGPNGA